MQVEQRRVIRLSGHHGNGQDGSGCHQLDPERAHEFGQHQGGLSESEVSANAHARPDTKRQVGEPVDRRGAGQKALRDERIRLMPLFAVPVQHPRCR